MRTLPTRRAFGFVTALLLPLYVADVRGAAVVVPNLYTNAEAPSQNAYPFAGSPTHRYQQVYASSQFTAFGGLAQTITHILFRPAGGSSPFSLTSNVQIDLSTVTAAPDSLGALFANNSGANNTTVYNGSLTMTTSASGSPGGPHNFDLVVPLQTPFSYDPTQGNLLMDVRRFTHPGVIGFLDATSFTTGDSVSRVYIENVSATSGNVDSLGLITQFVTPEPSAVGLLAIASAAVLKRKRGRS